MRIAIIGAGGVGSVLAAFLSRCDEVELSLVARGATAEALRASGLRVRTHGEEIRCRPAIVEHPSDLGHQDIVILAVKGDSVAGLAEDVGRTLGRDTAIVGAQNGIPWWFAHGLLPPEPPLETVDPGGAVSAALPPAQTVGCVIEVLPAHVIEPGLVEHGGALQLAFGTPGRDGPHAACRTLADLFARAGAGTSVSDDIRVPLWQKLMLNMAVNPTSVLTGARIGEMEAAEGLDTLMAGLMRECLAVAAAWGQELADDIDARIARGSGVPRHKTSMLQDFEAGRPMEITSVMRAVEELALRRGIPVPLVSALRSMVALRERTARGQIPEPATTPH